MKPTNRNHEKKRKIITLSDMLYDKYTNMAITVRSIRLERRNKARVESALKELKRAVDEVDKQVKLRRWKDIAQQRMLEIESENFIAEIDNIKSKLVLWKPLAIVSTSVVIVNLIAKIWGAI